MGGIFDSLGTAVRGIQVVQQQLATTSHNIANVDTPGYSRQRAVLETANSLVTTSGAIGQGVELVGVDRVLDQFTNTRLQLETSRRSALDTEASIYREVETIFNEQSAGGLSEELTFFFDSLGNFATSDQPGQPVARATLLASAQSVVDTVNRYDEQLRALQRGADRGITELLPEINALSQGIAELNGQISALEGTSPPNDLLDRRDELVRQLSEKVEISTFESAGGAFSVRAGSGIALVDGESHNDLVAVVDPSNANEFDPTFSKVHFSAQGALLDASAQLGGGELGALLEARDGLIGGAIRDLDALVFTFGEAFNAEHRTGLGLVDGAPHDFFVDLGASQPSVSDSARNFALSADIDPSQGGTVDNIAVARVAAAGGAGEGAVGNIDALAALQGLRTGPVVQFLAGDLSGAPTGGSRSIFNQFTNLAGEIGQGAQSANRSLAQQDAVLTAVQNRRDSVSGVSIDEEVADLVTLQAAFQANARVVGVVSSLFDDLLSVL